MEVGREPPMLFLESRNEVLKIPVKKIKKGSEISFRLASYSSVEVRGDDSGVFET